MSTYSDDSLLLLSGIQHFAFCPRQWALIHIERQWEENQRTVEGQHLHERAHDPMLTDEDDDLVVTRSIPLVSYTLGIYGMADIVEFRPVSRESGGIRLPDREGYWQRKPVEYKRGKPKPDDRDQVQLCAQALCLEEMLAAKIEYGDLFYGETCRRERVCFDQPLRQRVVDLCRGMHETFDRGYTPPAESGKRCSSCSLVDICIPELTRETHSVKKYIGRALANMEHEETEEDRHEP